MGTRSHVVVPLGVILVQRHVRDFDGEPAAFRHRVASVDGEVQDGGLELAAIDGCLP